MQRLCLLVCFVLLLTLSPVAPLASDAPSPAAARIAQATSSLFLPLVARTWRGPTSDQLIDRALAAGRIDTETALVYKVYAAFGDPRLPREYRGDDSQLIDSHALDDVTALYDTLSAPTQALLLPFLRPPAYVGSWFYLRTHPALEQDALHAPDAALPSPLCTDKDVDQWTNAWSRYYPVTIWWEAALLGDSDVAARMIAAIDGDIWPKLTGLMGTPLVDGLTDCAGDPDRLDIYILHGVRASTPPLSPPGCKKTPAYILIDATDDNAVLAHEFMHVLQWSYATHASCVHSADYAWLMEATAEWAMEYVYPGAPDPRTQAEAYLQDPTLSLDLQNDDHEYSAWLFFYFLARTQGSQAVRDVWNATQGAQNTGGVKAVDDVATNGLKGAWPQFVRWNWNRPPVDYYAQAGFPFKATGKEMDVTLAGGETALVVGPDTVKHLAASYTWLHFTDPNVRSVMFFNGLGYKVSLQEMLEPGSVGYVAEPVSAEARLGVYVGALVRINGAWRIENWTDRDVVTFCRDKLSERIEELVLIYGNSAYEPKGYVLAAQGERPTLLVNNIGCWKWEGRSTARFVGTGCDPVLENHADNLVWENVTGRIYPSAYYVLTRATLSCSVRTNPPCCGVNGSATLDESESALPGGALMFTCNGVVAGPSDRRMLAVATDPRLQNGVDSCTGLASDWPVSGGPWFTNGPTPPPIGQDGVTDGQYVNVVGRWTWRLTPQRE